MSTERLTELAQFFGQTHGAGLHLAWDNSMGKLVQQCNVGVLIPHIDADELLPASVFDQESDQLSVAPVI
jgi:hypothetical protein